MGVMDDIAGFFTGDNKKVENQVPNRAFAFIDFLLSDEEIGNTLAKVSKVVHMKDWLFTTGEGDGYFPYRNESLEQAIYVGQDVEEAVQYMKNSQAYQGVELNDDVLKTILTRFLTTIDVYEFTGLDFDLESLYQKVYATPSEMVNYIIEERQGKLDRMVEDPDRRLDPDFARRIYEYDFLVQRNGEKSMGDNNRVSAYANSHAQSVFDYYIKKAQGMEGAESPYDGAREPQSPQDFDFEDDGDQGKDY